MRHPFAALNDEMSTICSVACISVAGRAGVRDNERADIMADLTTISVGQPLLASLITSGILEEGRTLGYGNRHGY